MQTRPCLPRIARSLTGDHDEASRSRGKHRMILEDDEFRHWTSVDLWSDKLRSYRDDSGDDSGSAEEEQEETAEAAKAAGRPVDETRYTRREARLGVDRPRPLIYAGLENEDAEIRKYLASPDAALYQYWQVRLACSFSAAEGEAFERAKLKLRFLSSSGAQAPVAWSMAPDERLAPRTGTWHYKADFDLKFISTEVSRDVKDPDAIVIKAHNLLTSEPWWAMGGTGQQLDGNYQLALIARGPSKRLAGVQVTMEFTLSKARRWRRNHRVTIAEKMGVVAALVPDQEYERIVEDENERLYDEYLDQFIFS
jgi:hypothetical protein